MITKIKYGAIAAAFLLAAAPAALAEGSNANSNATSRNEMTQSNRGQTGANLTQAFKKYSAQHFNKAEAGRENGNQATNTRNRTGNLTQKFVNYGSSRNKNKTEAGSGAGR